MDLCTEKTTEHACTEKKLGVAFIGYSIIAKGERGNGERVSSEQHVRGQRPTLHSPWTREHHGGTGMQ
jgi:hypothetical protein